MAGQPPLLSRGRIGVQHPGDLHDQFHVQPGAAGLEAPVDRVVDR